jgi:hypothetical protein
MTALNGILMPCRQKLPSGRMAKYKLRTKTGDRFLQLNSDLELQAEEFLWDEVKVLGRWDTDEGTLRIVGLQPVTPQVDLPFYPEDESDVIREYRHRIEQRGRLTVEYEEMAS